MRKSLLLLSTLLFSGTLFAASLTPQEALNRAVDNSKVTRLRGSSPRDYILDMTGPQKGLYLFSNAHGGFIVVSADDTYPAVIGYSDAPFDVARISPSMRQYLDALDAQIASGVAPEKAGGKSRPDISPLVKAQWGQAAPYNGRTPELDGDHTLTGCIATAMAEIMNHWQHPEKGEGSVSYRWTDGKKDLAYDFAEHSFDWGNMADVYGEDATEAQKNAVSELMLACGMASQMQYSRTFSGATDLDAAIGLSTYLGYDDGIKVEFRDFYRVGPWTDMLYDELSAGRPILYCGFSSAGGHAFVCDGYQQTEGADYFHINWGWTGEGNGYFLINLLNPSYIGLGATATGFNTMQSAVMGIMPSDGVPAPKAAPNMVCFGYFASEKFDYKPGATIMFGTAGGAMRAGFYNMSLTSQDVTAGISLTDQSTGTETYLEGSVSTTLKPSQGIETFRVSMEGVAPGTYRVHPAFKIGEEWITLPEEIGMRTKMILTVTDEAITIDTTDDSSAVVVTQIGFKTLVIENDVPFYIEADLESIDYDEPVQITPVLLKGGYIEAEAETKTIFLAPGESGSLSWDALFVPFPEPGAYKIALLSEKSMLMTNMIDVVVVDENTPSEMTVSNVRMNKKIASTSKPLSLKGEELSVTFTLNCKQGWFDGTVSSRVMDGEKVLIESEADDIYFLQGQSNSGSYVFNVSELDPNATYGLQFILTDESGERNLGEPYLFQAPDASSVSLISEENQEDEYFTIDGMRLTGKPAGSGIYIRRNAGKAEKIIR